MRLMLAAAALLLPASASTGAMETFDAMPVAGKLPPQCKRPDRLKVSDKGKVTAQRLGDLPPATEIKALYRTDIAGCPDPIVIRDGVGMPNRDRPAG